eukprot:COSAG02_NODE_12860_length_1481_cov_1.044139_4_plen_21_part_01
MKWGCYWTTGTSGTSVGLELC